MTRLILFLLLLCLIESCQVKGTPKSLDKDKHPAKADMYISFNKHRSLLIVYGSQDHAHKEAYLSMANKIKERLSRGRRPLTIEIQSDETFQVDVWKELPSLLIGTPSSNKLLARIAGQLPLKQDLNSFELNGKLFEQADHAYQLSFYPNPDSVWTPLNIVSGNSEKAVLNLLENMTGGRRFGLWNSLPYQIFHVNNRIALGDFDDTWKIDQELSLYFDPAPPVVYNKNGIKLYQHLVEKSEEELLAMGNELSNSLRKVQQFLNKKGNLPEVSVYLYGSPEIIGMMKGEMKEFILEEEKIHKLVHPYFQLDQSEAENTWALRKLLGKPSNPVLEQGLAIYLCDKWQGKGYPYWSSSLFRSGDWQSIEELLQPDYGDFESPILKGSLAASLVSFLLDTWGKEEFLAKYARGMSDMDELKKLNKQWINYLKEQAELHPLQKRLVELPVYLKGMTFAHEGYAVYNGFGSSLAKKSLEEIRNHQVNTVSIVPYSGVREINKPIPFRISKGARSENDISVAYAGKVAQELGMKTMMKPQIWFGQSWPGDLEMKSEEDWDMFFKHYRRWILHYTLLAEIYEFDMLCVGVEFVKATGMQPEAWQKLAADMRKIFTGKITYAANWGEEIEKITPSFASELDFLGVDCYYPLSSKDAAKFDELQEGFANTMKKLQKISKKTKKPIIFTEIGFRSIPMPWKQPHAEAPDHEAMEEDQALCYRVVLEAMKNQDWQKGMIWWKWPSYMNYNNRSVQGFSPAGKEAAKVLKYYYGKEEIWE